MTENANLKVALKYASFGVGVFPCDTDKKPLLKDWLASASADPQIIAQWWRENPDALIGLPLKPLDLLVIDADRHHDNEDGVEALRKFCAQYGELPPHPWCTTANNGEHHFFKQPAGDKIGNKKIGRGLETRGFKPNNDGGYVVASGSQLADGRKWWRGGSSCSLLESYRDNTIPEAPAWLLDKLHPKPRPEPQQVAPSAARSHNNGSREAAYARAVLHRIAADLANAQPGARNNDLNAAGFRMGTMVARGWIGRAEVGDAITAACQANGLLKDDGAHGVQATLASGLRAGEGNPHPDLEDRSPEWRNDHDRRRHENKTETASPASSIETASGSRSLSAKELNTMHFEPIKYVVPGIIVEGLTGGSCALTFAICSPASSPAPARPKINASRAS